jgi:hypothetical protein
MRWSFSIDDSLMEFQRLQTETSIQRAHFGPLHDNVIRGNYGVYPHRRSALDHVLGASPNWRLKVCVSDLPDAEVVADARENWQTTKLSQVSDRRS